MDKRTIVPVSAPASGTPANCRKKFSAALLLAGGGLDAKTRAMIRNTSGGGLINKNSVAESTLTGSPHLSVFLRQNEKRKTCKVFEPLCQEFAKSFKSQVPMQWHELCS
jgi:hypothetical protein